MLARGSMVGITLGFNVLILVLFWLLSFVVISPVHNLFFQYAESNQALPILTGIAMQVRLLAGIVPLGWAVITIVLWKRLSNRSEARHNSFTIAHTSVTLLLGLALLLFFSIAGILPFLKISTVFQ